MQTNKESTQEKEQMVLKEKKLLTGEVINKKEKFIIKREQEENGNCSEKSN